MDLKNALSAQSLAAYIDHTNLKPETSAGEIEKLVEEALAYGFAAVCVLPCHVGRAVRTRAGAACKPSSLAKICSVVSFPFGAAHPNVKQAEAKQAIADGAEELDMVVNPAVAQAGDIDDLTRDIEALVAPCRQAEPQVLTKLILETAALTRETKILLCRLTSDLGVDFVKTSTGFHSSGGATVEDVEMLHQHRGRCRVKASGGISTLKAARAMIDAGAERIGTSSGIRIMAEWSALREHQ